MNEPKSYITLCGGKRHSRTKRNLKNTYITTELRVK